MEEFRSNEEMLRARKVERDQELAKLKTFQSQQLDELRARETESERLHENENELGKCIKHLRTELSKLDVHVSEHTERIQVSYDLRRIKMKLKNLSESVLRDLYYGNDLLERLAAHEHIDKQQLHHVRSHFDEQIESEAQIQRQIECMYESEAKSFAIHQQVIWLKECKAREKLLRDLINNQMEHLSNEADFIGRQQRELLDIRNCHLRAIDSANDRIESLLGANTADENQRSVLSPVSNGSSGTVKNSKDEICVPDLFSKAVNIAESSETPISTGRPEFGRKRVVWD